MYVFPGIGLGAVASRAKTITAEMLYVAALELSAAVTDDLIEEGRVFPPLDRIRQVSLRIAAGVAKEAEAAGLARQFPADNEVGSQCFFSSLLSPRTLESFADGFVPHVVVCMSVDLGGIHR